jgi:predicted membrane chloride channel (bestrophin family)
MCRATPNGNGDVDLADETGVPPPTPKIGRSASMMARSASVAALVADLATSADDRRAQNPQLTLGEIEALDAARWKVYTHSSRRQSALKAIMAPFVEFRRTKGTVILEVLAHPFLWIALAVYTATALTQNEATPASRTLGATLVTLMGTFLSFTVLFLNNENFSRFRDCYWASQMAQGRLLDVSTLANAALTPPAAAALTRLLLAAQLAAFVGLSNAYDPDLVLRPYADRHDLLTDYEWAALDARGSFRESGDRYRDLVAWVVAVIVRERDRGRCHEQDARILLKNVLKFRGQLGTGYSIMGQPIPFVYVHLVRCLTTLYLPVFAFCLARLGRFTTKADHALALLAIWVTALFFLGINAVSAKLADPYGHDLHDLRILDHCACMPPCCKSLLSARIPAATLAAVDAAAADDL